MSKSLKDLLSNHLTDDLVGIDMFIKIKDLEDTTFVVICHYNKYNDNIQLQACIDDKPNFTSTTIPLDKNDHRKLITNFFNLILNKVKNVASYKISVSLEDETNCYQSIDLGKGASSKDPLMMSLMSIYLKNDILNLNEEILSIIYN